MSIKFMKEVIHVSWVDETGKPIKLTFVMGIYEHQKLLDALVIQSWDNGTQLTTLPDLLKLAEKDGNMTVQTTQIGLRFTGHSGVYLVEICKDCTGKRHEVFDLSACRVKSSEQISY